MLKKIVVLLLVGCCGFLVIRAYLYLKEEVKKQRSPLEAVPTDAAVIIESNNFRSVWSSIVETNLVYSELLNHQYVKSLDHKLRFVDSVLQLDPLLSSIFSNKPTVLSFHHGNGPEFFLATRATKEQVDAVKKTIEEVTELRQENNKEYYVGSFVIETETYYFTYSSPFILLSSSSTHIYKSIGQMAAQTSLLTQSTFSELRATSSQNAAVQIFVNFPNLGPLVYPFLTKNFSDTWQGGDLLPEWMCVDLNVKPHAIAASGLSVSVSLEKNTISEEKMASGATWILPNAITSYERKSITSPKAFILSNTIANLPEIEKQCECDPIASFSSWIGREIISFDFNKENGSLEHALMIESSGTENLLAKLSSFGVQDTIAINSFGINIYPLSSNDFFQLLGIRNTATKPLYFTQLEDYAVFSSKEGLSKIIYTWKNSQTTILENDFTNFSAQLMANFSDHDYYSKVNYFIDDLKGVFKPGYANALSTIAEKLTGLNAMAWQMSQTVSNYAYHSFAINTKRGNAGQKSNILWDIALQTPVSRKPQLMKNHRTNTLEVVLQDENNVLHLISATGKIKWSKSIEEEIIGDITQIDIYGNSKFQMLFNTASKIHLIDINGNEVKNYPILLSAEASNQVSVMDYENTKEYRYLVATNDRTLLNYDKKGLPVEGWEFDTTSQVVHHPIQHFVTDDKDYIMVRDIVGELYLLNRKGERRFEVSQKIASPYLHMDKVSFQKGPSIETSKVIYRDTNDRFSVLHFNGEKTQFVLDSTMEVFDFYPSKLDNGEWIHYITTYGGKLTVYGPDKKVSFKEVFDFPIEQYVTTIGDDKKYTIIENPDAQIIYVYNKDFTPLAYFPAKGSIVSTSGDINNDGIQNLITVTNKNEIIAYSLKTQSAL